MLADNLLPPSFHILPPLVRHGFHGINFSLKDIKQNAGLLLIGASNSQGVTHMPDGRGGLTENNAYYWPVHHGAIAPELGGNWGLRATIRKAQQMGFREIWKDMVYGHLGYTGKDILRLRDHGHASYIQYDPSRQQVSVHDVIIPVKDNEVYFEGRWVSVDHLIAQGVIRSRETPEVQGHHWHELSHIRDPQSHRIIELWDEMAQLRLFNLHGFKHENPRVIDYLYNTYAQYVDWGITGFRLDAALYVPRKSTMELISRLNRHSLKTKNKTLSFLAEFLVTQDSVLHRIMQEMASERAKIYFLDFPQMYEIRRIHNEDNYQLNWYLAFLGYRNSIQMSREKLVPTLVNHDFGGYLHEKDLEMMSYALTEFTSFNPSLNFPHAGVIENQATNRAKITNYYSNKDPVGELISTFYSLLLPYRAENQTFNNFDILYDCCRWKSLNQWYSSMDLSYLPQGSYGRDSLVLRHRLGHRQLILYVKKDEGEVHQGIPGVHLKNAKVKYRRGDVKIHSGEVSARGRVILLIEAEY